MIALFKPTTPTDVQSATRSFQIANELDRSDLASLFSELRIVNLSAGQASPGDKSILAVAMAAAAFFRETGMQPYAVQHQAALVMARGGVAEMETGEGKTIAVALAAAAIAATGRSVHIATANAYLATRDQRLTTGMFARLGLSCQGIDHPSGLPAKRVAYDGDIVYGTVDTFAFDYLGDTVVRRRLAHQPLGSTRLDALTRDLVCRRRHAMVIDEIDHALIDEAITPLILASAPTDAIRISESVYADAAQMARQLERDLDWTIDEARRRSSLTTRGVARSLNRIPTARLARPWTEYVQRALDASYAVQRDTDYVTCGGEIILIDRATGRLAEGRQWQDGLYQAVQYREGLPVGQETTSAAQITRWRFLKMYHQLSGCSGTAWDCREELRRVYGLSTTRIPPRLMSRRVTCPPCFSTSCEQKWECIADEVRRLHSIGRPVLIGTCSVAQSLRLAAALDRGGLTARVLNGVQDEDEASIIAAAGQRGAITVATDMAGRGTDIIVPEDVAQLGGLHVIISEPRHSPRLDRQLVGRSARQGQPGSSRMFICAEDALLLQHGRGLARFLSRRLSPATVTGPLWHAVLKAAKRSEREMAAARACLAKREVGRDNFLCLAGPSPELTP